MRGARRPHDEEGSALILALVFITVIGLLIGLVLAYVETSYKYAAITRSKRAELYAADGATERAIARRQLTGACGDYSTEINAVTVDVTCEPAPRPPPPPVDPAPSPAQAILTLGQDPVEGLRQVAGSGPVAVRGDIFSHSVVSNDSGPDTPLQVDGNVAAVGDCTGAIQTSPPPPPPPAPPPRIQCQNVPPAGDPASAPDPGYPSDLTAVPVRRVAPACPQDRWLVTFEPGYYDDAVALSQLSGPACPGRVLWFTPGVYYFNFNFTSTGTTCQADPNLCTWHIADPAVHVVGGNARTWLPDERGPLSTRPTIELPGGCRSDDDGVQLVFGGQSRVAHTAGKVELCPRPGAALPPVALYGLKDGTAQEQTDRKAPATVVNGTPGFVNPENAGAVDEQPSRRTADATLTVPAPLPFPLPPPEPTKPASLTVRGFTGIVDGSRGADVRVRIVHRETGDLGRLTATVTTTTGPVAGSPFAVTRCDRAVDYCDDHLSLGRIPPEELPSLSVTYEVAPAAPPATFTDPPKAGTASLDGIELEVRSTPPALEGLGGCLTRPYDPATPPSCALFKTSGTQSALAIGGTVYTPTATIDLDLAGVAAPVFSRGVVAASLRLKIASVAGYSGPVVALPDVETKRAVLTLAGSRQGVVQAAGSGRSLIRGDVFSQSSVTNQSTAPLVVQGKVAAIGDCTGVIEVQAPPGPSPVADKRCRNIGGAAPAVEGADPVYPPAVDVVGPHRQPPPTCDGPVVALLPGYYDDVAGMARLTDGSCPGWAGQTPGPDGAPPRHVLWLKPGAYYFNFNFMADRPACAQEASSCTWTISDPFLHVVGGTTPGWDETAAEPGPKVDIPGGCRTDQPGVQLIFGGESRLHQTAGNLELCPFRKANALSPAIPLYGLPRGAAHEQPRSFPASATDASVGFTSPANAHQINEQPVRLTADVSAPAVAASGSITLSGFKDPAQPDAPIVPEGSRFGSAAVRVAHRETAITAVQSVTVLTDGGTVLASQQLTPCASFCETRIPLAGVTPDQLVGIKVTYEVAVAGLLGPKDELDGIELEVRSTPPSFEALSGCHVTGACALVKTDAAAKLALNGTVYAPTASVDLARDGLTSPIVNDGVIAGSVRLTIRPAACYTGPAISHLDAQFPSDPPEAGEVFTACVGGAPVLRSRVEFTGAAPKVASWSVLR